MKTPPFSLNYLKSILSYDPETGNWFWKVNKGSARKNQQTGCNSHGYLVIRIDKRCYPAHVLAWFYMTGEWAPLDIDHKNTIRNDNRWTNIRLASESQNGANRGKNKNNTTGYKGISYRKDTKKFQMTIEKHHKRYTCCFSNPEEAARAYDKKAIELFGEYAKLNFPTYISSHDAL